MSNVVLIDVWPSRAWSSFGCVFAAISRELEAARTPEEQAVFDAARAEATGEPLDISGVGPETTAELAEIAAGTRKRRAGAPKGEDARKLVDEMRKQIAAVTTTGTKGQNEKRAIRRKFQGILRGDAPTVSAVETTTQATKDFLSNIIGPDIDPASGLTAAVAADQVVKNLQTRATKLLKTVERQGLTPKNATAVQKLRKIADSRIAQVSKAHREEKRAEIAVAEKKATAAKGKAAEATLKAKTKELTDTQAAEETAQARRALDAGDLQGALNLANEALEALPGSGSDVALRQIVTAVKSQRKAGEAQTVAEAKAAKAETTAANKKQIADAAVLLEAGVEGFEREIFNEKGIVKDFESALKDPLVLADPEQQASLKTGIKEAKGRMKSLSDQITERETHIAKIKGGFIALPPKPTEQGEKLTSETAKLYFDFYLNIDIARQQARRDGWSF